MTLKQAKFKSMYSLFISGLVVVHFAANWAPQCKQIADVICELAKDNVHVKFLQVWSIHIISV